jgi:type II secretory pathway component GspD/PulD (secretin)
MNSTGKFSFTVFLCFYLILTSVLPCSVSPASEVAVIKVQHRWAAELAPIVESMLSADGTVTVSERVNSLVIVDTPEAIQRVKDFLDRFDRPVEQVRIHVRFNKKSAESDRAVAARGRISNDNVSVATGGKRKDGVSITVEDRQLRHKSDSEFLVITMSGSPAFIRTGKEIPYNSGSAFFRRYAPGGSTVEWHTVDSGFEVTPTIVGDNAHLKIVPRIAYDDGKDAVIRFFGAQTELTTPLGRWVEIGGAADQQNEVIREILSRGNRSGKTASSMSLMVERP